MITFYRNPLTKYLATLVAVAVEGAKFIASFFDQFSEEPLPICTSRSSVGKYIFMINLYVMILIETAPILIYACAYSMLYKQYKNMEAQHTRAASSNLLEIKKRMRNKVREFKNCRMSVFDNCCGFLNLNFKLIKRPSGEQIADFRRTVAFLHGVPGFTVNMGPTERPFQRQSCGSILWLPVLQQRAGNFALQRHLCFTVQAENVGEVALYFQKQSCGRYCSTSERADSMLIAVNH